MRVDPARRSPRIGLLQLSLPLLALGAWMGSATAAAQPSGALPAPGLYEAWSPVQMRPVGPLSAPPQALLPRWLSVAVHGRQVRVTFEPERRLVWRVRWGPHGPIEKITEVDGERFSSSAFTYDAAGHLRQKQVEIFGPAPARWSASVSTDAAGRVLSRTESLPLRYYPQGPQSAAQAAEWRVQWSPQGEATASQLFNGREVRRDHFDAAGLLLRTDWMGPRTPTGASLYQTSLIYERDRRGRLLRVRRIRVSRQRPEPADFTRPASGLDVRDLSPVSGSRIERPEALLLLGAPHTHQDNDRGAARQVRDNFSPDCWLNSTSTLIFDGSDLLLTSTADCICGFCVAAEIPLEGEEVLGTDEHFTEGPWIRLDGRLIVTADHALMTPEGPREAGALRAGDRVLDEEGRPRALTRVERLPDALRLGRNLRTRSGTFRASGFLLRSEEARACPPPSR